MHFRLLSLLGVAVALSGCFGSSDELWPTKNGESVPLKEGGYTCVVPGDNGGVSKEYQYKIVAQTEDEKLSYVITSTIQPPASVSFHKVDENLYILSAVSSGSMYMVSYMKVDGTHAVFLEPRPEMVTAYANEVGITLLRGMLLSNTTPAPVRRAFVIDIAKRLTDADVSADCAPST